MGACESGSCLLLLVDARCSASDVVRKLPPVERRRESRLTKLREKLPGIDLTRHQEPSYELVDAFSAMLEARSVRWVPFHKCASREQELSARSYNKELQVMQSHDGKLSLKEGQASRHANVSDGEFSKPCAAAPCRNGTRTSSTLLRSSPHKVSHRLQTRSCGRWVRPCRVMMFSLWTRPSRSSCSRRPLRCSLRAPSLSASIGQDLPKVQPKSVARPPPSPTAVASPSTLARQRVERPQRAGRVALLELQHGKAMPEEAVPVEASVHEVLWASPLYHVRSPVTR